MNVFARFARFLRVVQLVWFTVLRYKLFNVRNKRTPAAERERRLEELHERHAEWMLGRALKMRGLFIKLFQVAAARSDLVPAAYSKRFATLFDNVGAVPFSELEETIAAACGGPVDEVFASFEKEAMASASLAQVHRGVLKTGEKVAVKVQYPTGAKIILGDLRNLRIALHGASRIAGVSAFMKLFEVFGRIVSEEVDFVHEAENLERAYEGLGKMPGVLVPKPFRSMSSDKVLVMEWIDGIKITDTKAIDAAGLSRKAILARLVDLYFTQLFQFGFIHGDPHPGNLLVRKGPNGEIEIGFLDFGFCFEFGKPFLLNLGRLLRAVMTHDDKKIDEVLGELGFKTKKGGFDTLHTIAGVFMTFAGDVANGLPGAPSLLTVPKAQRENLVTAFPTDFVLLARTMILASGLSAVYGEQIELMSVAAPHIQGLVASVVDVDAEAA